MVYCVCLTGGIASGKSTAAAMFQRLGVPVILADQISRKLTLKGTPAYTQIVAHYGEKILNKDDGELNRKALREIIFNNSKEREWLEQLLHPLIHKEIKEQVDSVTSKYCIIENPLLVTKEKYPYINRILLIEAPVGVQIARVMQRDNCDQNQALSILTVQPSMELRRKYADDTVINNADEDALQEAVTKLHQKYEDLSDQYSPSPINCSP